MSAAHDTTGSQETLTRVGEKRVHRRTVCHGTLQEQLVNVGGCCQCFRGYVHIAYAFASSSLPIAIMTVSSSRNHG